MADVKAGGAYVEVFIKNQNAKRAMEQMQARWKRFGAQVQSIGQKLTLFGGIGVAALAPAIKAASDMEETLNKFNVVFAENSAAVRQWGRDLADEVGRGERQILDFLGEAQDLLVPMGIEPGAAEKMSKQLAKLSIDLASFNNKADADVFNDLTSALTGSSETVKKYGVIVNEAAVKQELFNTGLDPKEATEAEKAIARLNIIMRNTSAAHGDAVRSSDAFANQTKRLEAEIGKLNTQLGKALLPAVTEVVSTLAEGAGVVAGFASENPILTKTLAAVAVAAVGVGTALVGVGLAIQAASASAVAFNAVMSFGAAGLAGFGSALAVLAILELARRIYVAKDALNEFNRQMVRADRLTNKLNKRQTREQQRVFERAANAASLGQRQEILTGELEKAERELRGYEASVKGARKEVERLDTTLNRTTGNKLLELAQRELKETEDRAESTRDFMQRLKDEIERTDATIERNEMAARAAARNGGNQTVAGTTSPHVSAQIQAANQVLNGRVSHANTVIDTASKSTDVADDLDTVADFTQRNYFQLRDVNRVLQRGVVLAKGDGS